MPPAALPLTAAAFSATDTSTFSLHASAAVSGSRFAREAREMARVPSARAMLGGAREPYCRLWHVQIITHCVPIRFGSILTVG